MADLKAKSLALVSSVSSVNLAATAGTEAILYTSPTGFSFLPVMTILHNFSAADHATPPIVTLGIGGGACDEFLGDQTLSGLTANYANECLILQPVPAATPVTVDIVPAGSTFSIEITQANGAALTCDIEVFGYLF